MNQVRRKHRIHPVQPLKRRYLQKPRESSHQRVALTVFLAEAHPSDGIEDGGIRSSTRSGTIAPCAIRCTRAAEKCGVSQPTLTRAVQGLEQELNGLLIRRERGSTHPTDTPRSQCVNQSANAMRRCSKSAFTASVRRL